MSIEPTKPIKFVKTRPEQVNLLEEAVVPIKEVLVGVETGKIYFVGDWDRPVEIERYGAMSKIISQIDDRWEWQKVEEKMMKDWNCG